MSELQEELNEEFVKRINISKEMLNDDEVRILELVVEFNLIKLN